MRLTILALSLAFYQSCLQSQLPSGALLIKADSAEHYSIYRIEATKPLRLLSRQRGTYNHRLSLPAGDYLVLADCSHTKVRIKAERLTELQTFHLEFVPSMPATQLLATVPPSSYATSTEQQSYFPLQCSQFAELNLRQNFHNKFNFWLLQPQADLLIAAKQLAVDFKDSTYLRYDLSALRVGATAQRENYFIYPQGNLLAVTKRQRTGQWMSLLAGDYVVEFNGTRIAVSLQAKQQLTLPTAKLIVSANHADASDVVLFSDGKTIYYNQPFITLPTTLHLRLHRTSSPLTTKLTDTTTIAARSIALVPPCKSHTPCQEQHLQFFLYEQGEKTPFVSAKISERVFFARDNVSIAIEGSQGIRYQLPNANRDMLFKLGKLKVNYLKQKHRKRYTDLLRLEAHNRYMRGNSIDLRFGSNHGTLLIAGKYNIAHYISETTNSKTNESRKQPSRYRHVQPLRIAAGQTTFHQQKLFEQAKSL